MRSIIISEDSNTITIDDIVYVFKEYNSLSGSSCNSCELINPEIGSCGQSEFYNACSSKTRPDGKTGVFKLDIIEEEFRKRNVILIGAGNVEQINQAFKDDYICHNEPIIIKDRRDYYDAYDVALKEFNELMYGGLTNRQMREPDAVPVRTEPKHDRNSLCYCGSGLKYKKCHGKN